MTATTGREDTPTGRCPACDGSLVWSRVRYEPGQVTAAGMVEATWTGSDPTCHAAMSDPSHPCRPAPLVANHAPEPHEVVREPSLVA